MSTEDPQRRDLHTPHPDEWSTSTDKEAAVALSQAVFKNLQTKLIEDRQRTGQPQEVSGLNYTHRKKGRFFQLSPIENGFYLGVTSNKKMPGTKRDAPIEPLYIDEAGRAIISEGFSLLQPVGSDTPIIEYRPVLVRISGENNINIVTEPAKSIHLVGIENHPTDLLAMGRLGQAVSDLSESTINFPPGARPGRR